MERFLERLCQDGLMTISFADLAKSTSDRMEEETLRRRNLQWTWDENNKSANVEILNDSLEVRFNKRYSNGTAVVRCTEPMSNHQYYWEIKMNYPVYGTDIMIGVGTPEAEVAYLPDRYVSLLGRDAQTWGLSRHGLFHHNGERRCYTRRFDQGDVIGVHLDLWKGTLSFYKDRKHLGVACSGLKNKTLYAMASSTAACSGMRIVHASSFPSSLQFLCVAKLRELVPNNKNILDVFSMPPGLKQHLQNHLSWFLVKSEFENPRNIETNRTEIDDESPDFILPGGADRNTNNMFSSSEIRTERVGAVKIRIIDPQ